jgi:hypothetical protein
MSRERRRLLLPGTSILFQNVRNGKKSRINYFHSTVMGSEHLRIRSWLFPKDWSRIFFGLVRSLVKALDKTIRKHLVCQQQPAWLEC